MSAEPLSRVKNDRPSRWELWIDVGGTFTDCFARGPDGLLRRHKLLSSGATQGVAAAGSTRTAIVDSARAHDPASFWNGWRLRLVDGSGQTIDEALVARFDRARHVLHLTSPLSVDPTPGVAYDLTCDDEAPVTAIRYLLGLAPGDALPPVTVRLGTTRGTNALLTRRGARTALLTTRGFGDILSIGNQDRPRLFDLTIHKAQPLATLVVEIDERVGADGTALVRPDPQQVRRQLEAIKAQGIESLAICLLHAAEHDEHERLVAELAQQIGFQEISASSQVAPLVRIVPRGDTTVVNAYLNPVLRGYLERLRASLAGCELRVLTSAGSLVDAAQFAAKDSILSGPAGGVVGFSRVAEAAGFSRAIGFDMGGTSTDVSRYDQGTQLEFETQKAGVRIVAPMLSIETVAAGGGSICRFDGVRLIVGPESAGADPGPACYGRGGPLTVTDVNFFLGKIPAERFPLPLVRSAVEDRLAAAADEIAGQGGPRYELPALAEGFVRVANVTMAKAIRSVSLAKGCDPREYVLVPFGGAAGQHCCALADELGMATILCHPDAGLLSAYGIGLADVARHRVAGVYRPYSETSVAELAPVWERLAAGARSEVEAEGIRPEAIEERRALELRYRGVDASLTIAVEPGRSPALDFCAEHHKLYGYVPAKNGLEIVAARVEVRGRSAGPLPRSIATTGQAAVASRRQEVCFGGQLLETALFDRQQLCPGNTLVGPAIVAEATSTTVIDPCWSATVLSGGELLLRRDAPVVARPAVDSAPQAAAVERADPVLLEVFNHQFAGIAEQMGIMLRNTATSVNVKERLDFSCAIFTAAGALVVNAPHIPVHLGAMGETVRHAIADNAELLPGDVLLTNDPYRGGSHLPDLTVITPVHDAEGRLLFFTASRAHHAEIGGIAPGSMPPFSKNLAEEGVLIRNFKLCDAGRPRWDQLRQLLLSGAYPTRDVEANLADVAAQVAANRRGMRDLLELVERRSLGQVEAYMGHIQAAAAEKVRRALARIKEGTYRFTDHLDDAAPLSVKIEVRGDAAMIDFTGTGPVLPGNLNANPAITTAAVMYVLRSLVDEDIPLNQGVLAPVSIEIPECLLNPPGRSRPELCAAVAGGNVETSQRIVDVLLGSLRLAAASQGTMNNLLFGNEQFGYYETICGGAGATAAGPGADAVHTHMTNTRLTDPEILEKRYPVRLVEFSIRRGSGGAGRHRGGDGVVRRIEFLERLEVSLVTQRRGPFPPYGLDGGSPGALGANTLVLADGTRQTLGSLAQFAAQPGDQLVLETPGGGGWGVGTKAGRRF